VPNNEVVDLYGWSSPDNQMHRQYDVQSALFHKTRLRTISARYAQNRRRSASFNNVAGKVDD